MFIVREGSLAVQMGSGVFSEKSTGLMVRRREFPSPAAEIEE
jgi:hypothetical protein